MADIKVLLDQFAKDITTACNTFRNGIPSLTGTTGPMGPPGPQGPPGSVTPPPPPPPPPPTQTGFMHTAGRQVLSASGAPFVARGVEMIVGPSFGPGASVPGGVTDFVASIKANAFRPNGYSSLSTAQIIGIIKRCAAVGIVPYVAFNEGNARFADSAVKAALQAIPNLVIDGLLEAEGDPTAANLATWLTDAKAVITDLRAQGYKHPISIHSVQSGRQLRAVLDHGAELVSFDPLHNVIMGCQMYWPIGGFEWQADQGFGSGAAGIAAAFAAIAAAPFPIQLGFATGDENKRPNPVDQQLTLAGAGNVPWLWWDLWEGNTQDTLYLDDQFKQLTPSGALVINNHAAGFKSAQKLTSV